MFLLAESAPCPMSLETFSESVVLLPHCLSHPKTTLGAVSGQEILQLSPLFGCLPLKRPSFYRGCCYHMFQGKNPVGLFQSAQGAVLLQVKQVPFLGLLS